MNDAERIWSEKSDEDLLEAAAELGQFTDDGRRIIRAELKRRGLEDPVEQAAIEAGANVAEDKAMEPECLRCHVRLLLIDPDDEETVARWSWLGGLGTPGGLGLLGTLGALAARPPERKGLDIYICPSCGHVDFFADLPEEEEAREESDDEPDTPTGKGGWAPG